MSHLFLRCVPRTLPARNLLHHRTLTTTPRLLAWKGSSGEDHITNSKDELDVHSAGAKSGKRDRAEDNQQSSAASEHDSRQDNKRAKEEHPEAPGPVIGMNDERGGDIEGSEQSGGKRRGPDGAIGLGDVVGVNGTSGGGEAGQGIG